MPGFRKREKHVPDDRPVVVDDFIYEDPEDSSGESDSPASDTPEEAIHKLRVRQIKHPDDSAEDESSSADPEKPAGKGSSSDRKVYSSGVILDDDLQPVDVRGHKPKKEHRLLRGIFLTGITLVLLLTIAAYIFHRISPDTPGLGQPESLISRIMTPVQSFFSGLSETVFGYFRSMKYRGNLEAEYNNLRAENERLAYKAMLADELQHTLSRYEDLSDEIHANESMEPIVCTIIGKSDSNYFSTFTINKGTEDGVTDYMAVTISGALVGYTENTQPHSATVRAIIDSNASIAALIQSSRDQGTVRGTLGIDSTPMCRMYYLPDDNLPRPGDLVVTSGVGFSFPKGIPIGVVRESTRGMEDNKQYIVLEPLVDFQHLEYVIVLRYKPEPEAIVGRENGRTSVELVPLESARPSPVVPEIAASLFETTSAQPETDITPSPDLPAETPSPEPTVTPSPSPSPEPAETPEPAVYQPPLEYHVVNFSDEATPAPTPTWAPTSTPYLTPDPEAMDWEEDD